MPEAVCCCVPEHCICDSRGLTSIPQNLPTSISKLYILYLGNNRIRTVNKSELLRYKNLSELSLVKNQIATIHAGTFANLAELQRLYLPELQRLYLSKNQVKYIPSGTFANLPKLQILNLSQNKITTIHSGAFENLIQLKYLLLNNNKITTIHSGAFENLPDLYRLVLEKNKMTTIPLSVFCLIPSTNRIELYRNPWQCDCRMAPVRLIYALTNQIFCGQPVELHMHGQKLANVDPKKLICKDPSISPLTSDSCSAAASTPSVSNTESNTSPPVFKTTAGSTANPAENTSKTRATLISVGSTESNTSPPVFKTTADSTANPAEKTSKSGATLTSPLAITSEKPESTPSSPQLTTSKRIADIHLISHNSHYHWYFKFNAAPMSDHASKTRATLTSPLAITSNKPESAPSSQLSVLMGSVCGSVAGTTMIGTFLAVIWYKKRTRNPPLGLNPGVVVGINTNTTASVVASGHDHQYENIDNPRVKAGQGQSQANTASNTNTTATVMTSGHDQTGQGQSQANTASNTNTTAAVMTSGHDQTGQGQSQANTASNTNTTAAVMTSGHDQTGQGQSQANIQSLKVGNLSHNEFALQPNPVYLDVKSPPKDASTEIANSNDQTGQGQSQAVTESLDVRNLSYGTGQTASQQNSVYKVVTQSQTITNTAAIVMTSGDDQTGQGQSQAITESLDARNLSYGTGPTDSKVNFVYTKLEIP
ncbi:uncharacterized protein LOC144923289 [Branchiostoma floridae x Branchiostoma belcheri]